MNWEQRAEKALTIAHRFGAIEGDHHRAWVIDQIVRALTDAEAYKLFVADYDETVDGEVLNGWDTGIAP